MYKSDGAYYCVKNCSLYDQYHSPVDSVTEAKCMTQCTYLTYVDNRIHCIDECNYIAQYPNMTEDFCLAKCGQFVLSVNYSMPQCNDKSCTLPWCVEKCPIGYYAVDGKNCAMIEGCTGFFTQSNECNATCASGYFQYQYGVRVCISGCQGYTQPYELTGMKECLTGKKCTDREAPFYSLPERKCVSNCSGYFYAESSRMCLYNCLQPYYKLVNGERVCTTRCAAPLSVAVADGAYTMCKAPCEHAF